LGLSKKLGQRIVSDQHFHARQAAAALLKMAKTTSNLDMAAGLVQAAADLKDQAGELPPLIPAFAPDVPSEVPEPIDPDQ